MSTEKEFDIVVIGGGPGGYATALYGAAAGLSVILDVEMNLHVKLCAGWGLSQLVHGDTRDGVLALGLAPAEVASVGLIGLMGGATELALAVLTVSLVLSALAGPPVLAVRIQELFGWAARQSDGLVQDSS